MENQDIAANYRDENSQLVRTILELLHTCVLNLNRCILSKHVLEHSYSSTLIFLSIVKSLNFTFLF